MNSGGVCLYQHGYLGLRSLSLLQQVWNKWSHGQQLLIDPGFMKGKTVTYYPGIEIDIVNAGGNWVDQEVVRDGLLLTGRKRSDTEAFDKALVEFLKEYKDSHR